MVEKVTKRDIVLRAIVTSLQGICCHEIERKYHMPHTTVSSRITELKYDGMIKDNGERRFTPAKRPAAVYVASAKGRKWHKNHHLSD